MKKVTDLNVLSKDNADFSIDGKKITKAELYGKNLLEIINLVNQGRLLYYINQ